MELNLDSLQKAGGFTGAPVRKEITWKQGDDEHTGYVYVRRMSYHTAVSDIMARKADSADRIAMRIAACVCDASGKPVFTCADITGEADPERGPMDANLTVALLAAIAEVNKLGGKPSTTH